LHSGSCGPHFVFQRITSASKSHGSQICAPVLNLSSSQNKLLSQFQSFSNPRIRFGPSVLLFSVVTICSADWAPVLNFSSQHNKLGPRITVRKFSNPRIRYDGRLRFCFQFHLHHDTCCSSDCGPVFYSSSSQNKLGPLILSQFFKLSNLRIRLDVWLCSFSSSLIP
jgi:hypothetical protein